jgi:hypothetical protein
MANQPGYWAVTLDNGGAGVARAAAGQKPVSVSGHAVRNLSYLGTTEKEALANWRAAVDSISAYGLFEVDPKTLFGTAKEKGAGIFTKTPSSAEWDPTFTVIAAGAGGIVAGAVRAAAAGAAGEGAVGTAAGEAGTGAVTTAGTAGTVGKVLSSAGTVAKTVAGSLTVASLFTNTSLWAGVGMTLLGVFLVLFGIVKLSGADPKTVARRVMP